GRPCSAPGGFPATRIGPLRPPAATEAASLSESPPFFFVSPWHDVQRAARTGATSRASDTVSAAGAARWEPAFGGPSPRGWERYGRLPPTAPPRRAPDRGRASLPRGTAPSGSPRRA